MNLTIKEIKNKYFKRSPIDPYQKYVSNIFSPSIVKLLMHTPITANQVSLFSLLSYILCALLIGFNKYMVFVFIILQILLILDSVDGTLSRAKKQNNLYGEYMEYITHECIPSILFFGLAFYSYKHLNSVIPLILNTILLISLICTTSFGTSKGRIMFCWVIRERKLPPKLEHANYSKSITGFKRKLFLFLSLPVSMGVFTLVITLSYYLNLMQYLIYLYTPYFFSIMIFKFKVETKRKFEPWGLK